MHGQVLLDKRAPAQARVGAACTHMSKWRRACAASVGMRRWSSALSSFTG